MPVYHIKGNIDRETFEQIRENPDKVTEILSPEPEEPEEEKDSGNE